MGPSADEWHRRATHKSGEVPEGLRESKKERIKGRAQGQYKVYGLRNQKRTSQGDRQRAREAGGEPGKDRIPKQREGRVSGGSELLCCIPLGQVSQQVDYWVYQYIGDW